MTDTSDSPAAAPAPKKRAGGLNSMLLADLKAMAGGMGISGAGAMKKAQIVEAIKSAQAGGPATSPPRAQPQVEKPAVAKKPAEKASVESTSTEKASTGSVQADDAPPEKSRAAEKAERHQSADDQPAKQDRESHQQRRNAQGSDGSQQPLKKKSSDDGQQDPGVGKTAHGDPNQAGAKGEQNQPGTKGDHNQPGPKNDQNQPGDQGDDDGRGGRNRRRRGRERDRTRNGPAAPSQGGPQRNEPDTTILEDDVLVPAAGILDVLDNYAFVRTSGYLPGVDDVYLSLSMVRKFGLRRGDAIVGQVRQPREGERKEKFNPMVRIDNVNGADPQQAGSRPDFEKLTPVHPTVRLRMETDAANLTGRAIDLAAPIGKGQRGLIVSPAKAGKTMALKSIAHSIGANNPECHLMVVLVDERPEEVTDFERSVKGEVIASTFDRQASDHTLVAELAIERAKRLVELGHDVVVLLDGITRLGRAYNATVASSGRVLSGGVDVAALYPPKKFFGAARNVENGGSLTIIATALVESGSRVDEVILEEFNGTDNMELRLRRDVADKRLFPAIDVARSGTRREELLMGEEELSIVSSLRRTLASLPSDQATEALLERLTSSKSNIELLTKVQRSTTHRRGAE
ncbi:MAG: transcription termination factor Rho [Nocardioides sp.]